MLRPLWRRLRSRANLSAAKIAATSPPASRTRRRKSALRSSYEAMVVSSLSTRTSSATSRLTLHAMSSAVAVVSSTTSCRRPAAMTVSGNPHIGALADPVDELVVCRLARGDALDPAGVDRDFRRSPDQPEESRGQQERGALV